MITICEYVKTIISTSLAFILTEKCVQLYCLLDLCGEAGGSSRLLQGARAIGGLLPIFIVTN